MNLAEFKKDKIVAMKNHEKEIVSALNEIISKLMLVTIEKRAINAEVTEIDVVNTLKKTESELLEEREAFKKAERAEKVTELDKEIECVRKYLPAFLSAEEIKAIIMTISDKSVPSVMKHFKAEYAGKVDMKVVSEVMKTL